MTPLCGSLFSDGGADLGMMAAGFQSFPDSYPLPANNRLACQIIGNAVSPMAARRIVGSLVGDLEQRGGGR